MEQQEVEKQLKILSAIMHIHQSIGANLELDEIGRVLVGELIAIIPCDGCAILLFDGEKVGILAERGFQVMLGGKAFTTEMPTLQHIISTKQSIYTGDIRTSTMSSCVPEDCVMRSIICTPIIVSDEVVGIIHLDAKAQDVFTEEDLHFVEVLAKEISLAVARSMQYSHIKAMAVRDPLTGCYNRRKFDEDLSVSVARSNRYERPLSLLLIDIDWFKTFNDFHGHPRGDELLKQITAFLSRAIRHCDQLYRYGGEEFTIVLPETNKEGAYIVAKRICEHVKEQDFYGARESQPEKRLTVSIGIASLPADANTQDDLLRAADSALYKAKQSGRNTVCAISDT